MTDLSEQYILRNQLGEDDLATVYRAIDRNLERVVAIKQFRCGDSAPDSLEQISVRFGQAIKLLARLSHTHVAKIFGFGEQSGAPYWILEYMPDGNLKQKTDGQTMAWQDAVTLILKIADALQFAYKHAGVVHRDIKLASIFFGATGEPMLTDFGIAKILGADGATLTGDGVGIGTPGYMAPEEWMSETTSLSNQYSLGVVLYEMITGHRLYDVDAREAIMIKQINQPPPKLRQFVPDLPDVVEAFILKVLSKEPADRYMDMVAFIKAGKNLLLPQLIPVQVLPAPARKQRSRWSAAFFAGVLIVFGALIGKILWPVFVWAANTAVILPMVRTTGLTETPNSNSTPIVDLTLTFVATINPALTSAPLPSLTATPTAIPVYLPITLDNARNLTQINQWDAGMIPGSVDFSPDGRYLASGSEKSGIRIWELAIPGKFTQQEGRKMAFSPDGDGLAILNGGLLEVRDFPGLEKRWDQASEIIFTSLAFSANGDLLAVGGYDGRVRVLRTSDGNRVRFLGKVFGQINGLAFSKNGSLLAAIGSDGNIIIWRMGDGTIQRQLRIGDSKGLSIAFSPDRQNLATGSADGIIRVYQVSNGVPVYKVSDKNILLYGLLYANNNDLLISGDYYNISLWRARDGQKMDSKSVPAQILALDISYDSRFLVSGSDDGIIRIWAVSP